MNDPYVTAYANRWAHADHVRYMDLWRETGRKYWLNKARLAWRLIVMHCGPLS